MPTLKPGQILDRYQIIAFLANGGMGEVYHARHQFMDSDVALKLVFPHLMADPAIAERFQREVRSIAKLRHEHIIKVFDAGLSDGHHFMAMEYLGAGSLAKELQIARETGQKIPIQRAIEITRQIALALDYAHRAGFSHRDVKPGNILKRSADKNSPGPENPGNGRRGRRTRAKDPWRRRGSWAWLQSRLNVRADTLIQVSRGRDGSDRITE